MKDAGKQCMKCSKSDRMKGKKCRSGSDVVHFSQKIGNSCTLIEFGLDKSLTYEFLIFKLKINNLCLLG